jgi:hypothetical protein
MHSVPNRTRFSQFTGADSKFSLGKRERESFTYTEKETVEDWKWGEHEESGHMLLVFIVPVETWLWGGQQQLQLF